MKRKVLAVVIAAATALAPASAVFAKSSEAAPDWEAYDELISEIKTTTDFAEREAMMHEAEDILQ